MASWSQQYGDVKGNLSAFTNRVKNLNVSYYASRATSVRMPGDTSFIFSKGLRTSGKTTGGGRRLNKSGLVNRMRQGGGLGAIGQAGKRGGLAALGFSNGKFLGGMSRGNMGRSLGMGAFAGLAVGAMTDSPLAGTAAGVATAGIMGGSVKGGGMLGGRFGRFMGLGFTAMMAMEGMQQGGIGGAIGGVARSTAEFALFDAGFKAVGMAFKGTAIGALGSNVAAGLGLIFKPLAIGAAIGYSAYKAADYLAGVGRGASLNEFGGSTEAFNTRGAYTMRQRAMQEISRSHTNSRVVLGQEASLMHMR